MLIRDIERPIDSRPRDKARTGSPLRKAAEGLGAVLGELSEDVRRGGRREGGDDSVESDVASAGKRSRGFKLRSPKDEEAAGAMALTEEQGEVFDMLKEARRLAADASALPVVVPGHERAASQARVKEIFTELSAKRIEALSSIFDRAAEDDPLFSLATPESARAAYRGIDEMILKFLNAGKNESAGAAGSANSIYSGHEAALSATEQLKEFLLSEGPAKAFARFREVNRSNVLGLLQ
ncbi:MAG: hypothetical protein LBH93_03760 [Chitinispirillales bacterium]|jgi:hypothetical protein|nr:hypothetical protein [Chitinispirillales bacterium]